MSLGAQKVSYSGRFLGGIEFGFVEFGFGFRVLFECQLLRFWFWARAGFGARILVLVGFWCFGTGLKFNFKVRSGYLIVIGFKERHE